MPDQRKHPSEYKTWSAMKARCLNPKDPDYPDYGDRGITVSGEWINDFGRFYQDVGPRPDGFTLERIDNEKGYEPGNVRWASWSDQANNRRNNRRYEWKGELKTIAQISKESGVSYHLIYQRINTGWDIKRAVLTPAKVYRPKGSVCPVCGQSPANDRG